MLALSNDIRIGCWHWLCQRGESTTLASTWVACRIGGRGCGAFVGLILLGRKDPVQHEPCFPIPCGSRS